MLHQALFTVIAKISIKRNTSNFTKKNIYGLTKKNNEEMVELFFKDFQRNVSV